MKKRVVVFLAALLLISSSAFATFPSSYNWEFWSWGGGGAFCALTADTATSGRVFAVSDVSGPQLTTDGGANWTFSTSGTMTTSGTCVIQAPSSSTTWYKASGRDSSAGGVESSTDNGVTWTNHLYGTAYCATIASHKALAVNRTDANTAYASFSAGSEAGAIWRTTNRTTWTQWRTAAQTGFTTNMQAMVIDKTNTYLYMGGSGRLVRITLSDGTVTPITLTGTDATRNYDLVATTINGTNYVFADAGSRLAYTTDNSNWSYTAAPGLTSGYYIRRFDVFPGASFGATKIVVGAGNGDGSSNQGARFKSSDGGATWSSATGTLTYDSNNDPTRAFQSFTGIPVSIITDPHDATGATWYMSEYWGIWKTTDFGVNWVEKIRGAGNSVGTDIDIAPNGTVIATSMDNGVMTRSNGDSYWTMRIPNATSGFNYPQVSGHAWQIIASGTSAQWNAGTGKLLATFSPWASLINKPIRSTNNGSTWTIYAPPAQASGHTTADGLPDNPTSGGIWGNGYMRGVTAFPSDDQHILATIDGTWSITDVAVTADSTTDTFTRANHGLVVNDRCLIRGTTPPTGISATTRYFVINTTTNTFQVSTTKGGSAVNFSDNGSGVTMNKRRDGGLFESTDGGQTWNRLVYPGDGTQQWPSFNVFNGIAVNPTDETNWIMARWGTGMYRTANSGSSWANATSGSQSYCYEVKFSSTGVAYATCDNSGASVYRSTDKGINWTKIKQLSPYSGSGDALAIDPADPDSLVVSTTSPNGFAPQSIYHTSTASTDSLNSNNFVVINGNLPTGQGFGACEFNNTDGYLYCNRLAGGVFRMNLQTQAPSIGALTSTNVEPASLVQATAGNLVITLDPETAIVPTDKIEVTMGTSAGPWTFSSGGASAVTGSTGFTGASAWSVSVASNVLTLTPTGGTDYGTAIKTITVSNVLTPPNAVSTGTYSIRTMDSNNNIKDQDLAVSADTILPTPLASLTPKFTISITCQNCSYQVQ